VMLEESKTENRPAFEQYLLGAPQLNNTSDQHQCGSVRNYFGFDELFINDKQICEDITQLKYSRDFDFLDEFFKQGHDDEELDVGAPELVMVPPDRCTSILQSHCYISNEKSLHVGTRRLAYSSIGRLKS